MGRCVYCETLATESKKVVIYTYIFIVFFSILILILFFSYFKYFTGYVGLSPFSTVKTPYTRSCQNIKTEKRFYNENNYLPLRIVHWHVKLHLSWLIIKLFKTEPAQWQWHVSNGCCYVITLTRWHSVQVLQKLMLTSKKTFRTTASSLL